MMLGTDCLICSEILHVSTTAVKTNLLCNYNLVNTPTLETGIERQLSLERKLLTGGVIIFEHELHM